MFLSSLACAVPGEGLLSQQYRSLPAAQGNSSTRGERRPIRESTSLSHRRGRHHVRPTFESGRGFALYFQS